MSDTTSEAVELLLAARDRIADPYDWCQGTYSKDSDGCEIPADSPEASSWCAVGALWWVSRETGESPADLRLIVLALRALAHPLHSGRYDLPQLRLGSNQYAVEYVNDRLGHAAVMDMYDDAIADLKGQAS